ncbi:hypothetical protein BASA82_000300 [Batrachochytrium salamandrivorans]|nr:hypothetical protein BASA81_002564 [Batrachochytrium salamandrivorans]KAH9262653.1 hypothetical protein BASA82_000300 [Batrachochytrium salamandrivorans]
MNQTALDVGNAFALPLSDRAERAFHQLLYSAHAFAAMAVPVSISMILSSLCVVFVNDGLNGKTSGGTGIPVVFEESASSSSAELFSQALVNALVIVGVIILATVMMVVLYYFKFMRVLIGYLMITTAMLLAVSTGLVVQTLLQVYQLPLDAVSYSLLFYNFAVVGVLAIFYQRGLPSQLTGGYLICISVTMAWILLRYLPEWTCWVLLAVLALYDLCAVLTPCGPLKWLVKIMQTRSEPLPGLLYEARFGNAIPPTAVVSVHPVAVASVPQSHPTAMVSAPPSHSTQQPYDDDEEDDEDQSIKLGLGDFVFYSLLCARASLVSFTTFIAVFVVILFGLAVTLVLLAVYKTALPALPVSIFLGLAFFFATDAVIVPMVRDLAVALVFV